jgi:hypothetical protein
LTIRLFVSVTAIVVAIPASRLAAADSVGIEFFEAKVRPILADNCYKCHSKQAEKVRGGLLLDTREGLLKGGDTGPAIVPSKVDESLLIKAVRYGDENLQMPPKGKKLSPGQIASLEEWVRIGAPDPRTSTNSETPAPEGITARAKNHWAFQPILKPPLPLVRNLRWAQSPVDKFVLANLERNGLSPSPRADRRTLIRRATFDLIGLPPTPSEVASFEADDSSDAFARLVDRLLASPQYGERWGRHWLDVARYADTKGYVFEEERRYPYSYTYRDYVIRSFNEDLPFDQFILQQIAADLLPLGEDKRPLAALGYLTLGRRFVNNIHDIIDDRIDVVCRGMMGLTVSCARCHDHKFDPIPTVDYYSLYGVFASSTEPAENPLLGPPKQSKQRDDYLAERERRINERVEFRRASEEEISAKLRRQTPDYLLAAHDVSALSNAVSADELAHKRKLDPGVLHRWIKNLEDRSKQPDPIFAPWFAFCKLSETNFEAGVEGVKRSFAEKDEKLVNPLLSRALSTNNPGSLKDVAALYGGLLAQVDLEWRQSQTNHSLARAADPGAGALRQVLYASDAPPNIPAGEFDRLFEVAASQKLRALQRKIDELDATHPGAPPRAMALADLPQPHNVHVFIRGNSDNPGPEAPRRFVGLLSGSDRKPFQHGSGRLELAQAIASPGNPLTARVLVNRVWAWHFGTGLVQTPSDFGLRADPPSEPELLDYLAACFIEDGWSIKKLHRRILLSSTYQQSSQDNPRAEAVDPDNRWLWRMNRQRLDFEAQRDALLAIAGNLDSSAGGHAVDITTDPSPPRRTVYAYIDRQNLPSLFRTFDFASPDGSSPQRFHTTVPQQALFFMNSPFVVSQAKTLVARPEFSSLPNDAQRVQFLYQLAYQRDPAPAEIAMAREFCSAPAAMVDAPQPPAWRYGFGEYDEGAHRVSRFEPLPHFTGSAFQGGPELPDSRLGWVMLNATGGHPGDNPGHAAIRRWTAPRDGVVSVTGKFSHAAEAGDGVRGRLISSRLGELGQWTVHHEDTKTAIDTVEVHRGETLDFVTDCRSSTDSDSFTWTVRINYTARSDAAGGESGPWDSKKDFGDSPQSRPSPLTRWEQYAQVLLLANEMVFVD